MAPRGEMSWQDRKPGIRADDLELPSDRVGEYSSAVAQVTMSVLVGTREDDRVLAGRLEMVTQTMRWHFAGHHDTQGESGRGLRLLMPLFTLLALAMYLYACCCSRFHPLSFGSDIDSRETVTASSDEAGSILSYLFTTLLPVLSMVSMRWGGLAARASMLVSSGVVERADQAAYIRNNLAAIKTLQSWYNTSSGLWDTTGWWNSGNCLTVLADFASLDPTDANGLGIAEVMNTTFTNAQQTMTAKVAQKSLSDSGMTVSHYTMPSAVEINEFAALGSSGFINDYFDDEGWWALALLHSYDVNHDPGFLDVASHIFEDMKAGTDSTCGGGIWWSKDRNYKNAIANELYLSVTASLANRVPSQRSYYLDIAQKQWAWFKSSGMINSQDNINDGLTINADGSCTNNGKTAWSYNQGVVLGGLVELARASGDSSYLTEANILAAAAIKLLSDNAGVIHDAGCEPSCGGDGNQFKGIFMRNLGYLNEASPQAAYKSSILANADAIWARNRNAANDQLGVVWSGPYTAGGGPTAATQSSALDALVAALRVA